MRDKRKCPPRLKTTLPQASPSKIAQWIDETVRYPVLKGKSRQFNIRIPWGLYRMIELEALNRNVSISDFVRGCLILHTVPARLLEMAKQDPQAKLSSQEAKMLEEYRSQLRRLLDDLKLVEYQLGDEGIKLPRPEIFDMEYIEKLLDLKAKKLMSQYQKALKKQKEKKPK